MAEIRLRAVNKSFGKTHVIQGVDLDVEEGEFCVFVGPSGCGKSTLLRLIAGLEDISSGELYLGGRLVNDVAPAERGVAMVFQSYALYPHMNVYRNMAFGLKLARKHKDEIEQRVRHAARILQIEHLLERLPKELSGGQRQRVAIGRAIVRQPRVFLFDEPLSNLDAALRVQTRIEIYNLHKSLRSTMVYVTHDQVEAMTLADKIVILDAGRVAQVGAPLELYHRPDNLFVAGFIGSPRMNFLPARLVEAGTGSATVRLRSGLAVQVPVDAAAARADAPVTLGIRPEHVRRQHGDGASAQGEVQLVEHLGDGSLIYVKTAEHDELVVVKEEGVSSARAGEALALALPEAACHLFDEHGRAFARRSAVPMPS